MDFLNKFTEKDIVPTKYIFMDAESKKEYI